MVIPIKDLTREPWELLWDELRDENCTMCPLHEMAEFVCLLGVGPVPCDYMIVGEAPGAREDEEFHRPFAGPAGELLDKILKNVGLNRNMFYITNSVRCRPEFNRDPEKSEVQTCWGHYGLGELERVQPKHVILMGNYALQAITGKTGITAARGKPIVIGNITYHPTFHTAFALRNPSHEKTIEEDLIKFKRAAGIQQYAKETKPILVLKRRALQKLVQDLMKSDIVAFDLETEGLDQFIPGKRIWCISLSKGDGIGYVVPLEHPSYPGMEWAYDEIKPLLESKYPRKVAHNGKFDSRWLKTRGINPYINFDSLQAAHMLDENRKHDLKNLAQAYLGVKPWGTGAAASKLQPMSKLAPYAAKDTDYDAQLYKRQRTELENDVRTRRVFQYITSPAVRMFTDMEFSGMPVDRERLAERRETVLQKRREIDIDLGEMVGVPVGGITHRGETKYVWNSPQQLAKIMFTDRDSGGLGLPIFALTPKGQPSTAEATLVALKDEHPFVNKITEWRLYDKWWSTYLNPWTELTEDDPFIHASWKIEGTVTGRTSCSDPNLQQVPRNDFIRGIIGGVEGWFLVEADYSQIEVRLTADSSGDSVLRRIYLQNQDVHRYTASRVMGIPEDQVTEVQRKKAKAVVFGFIYGMGAPKFKMYAKNQFDLDVTIDEAFEFRYAFFNTYPSLEDWHDKVRKWVRNHGYIRSPIGRLRRLPDINSRDKEVRAEAERQGINSPIQGLASDHTILAMNLLSGQLQNQVDNANIKRIVSQYEPLNPEEARLCGTVHDSIMFLVREDRIHSVEEQIKYTMENLPMKELFGWESSVPIKADTKIGSHWQGMAS